LIQKFILRVSLLVAVGIMAIGCECSNSNGLSEAEKTELDSIFSQLPETLGEVSDFESLLKAEQKVALKNHVLRINGNSPYEVVLVTIDTIAPFDDIVTYATALGNKWAIGNEEDNNGLVILVSSNLGQAAIAPGNGIEDVFSDEVTKKIIEDKMIPHFMRGDFAAGFDRALREVDRIAAENTSASQ
jgi:uncharacterized protein